LAGHRRSEDQAVDEHSTKDGTAQIETCDVRLDRLALVHVTARLAVMMMRRMAIIVVRSIAQVKRPVAFLEPRPHQRRARGNFERANIRDSAVVLDQQVPRRRIGPRGRHARNPGHRGLDPVGPVRLTMKERHVPPDAAW
jgi:hypothetical protein